MTVGLFVPCYIDQLYPQVARATLELLEKLGCTVEVPAGQGCCGQPMANSGFAHLTGACDKRFINNFAKFDYIVCPSGSCVLHVNEHLSGPDQVTVDKIRSSVFELTEFLTDVLKITELDASFPHKTGLHTSCHGQRGLELCSMSERMEPAFSKPEQLLRMVKDIEVVKPRHPDECCGFGGTFCVFEEAVSVKMGQDRLAEQLANSPAYITGVDISCLMHLEGIAKRQNSQVRMIHIAEILNSPPAR